MTIVLLATAAIAGIYAAGYVASVAVLLWLQGSVAEDAVENALSLSVFWPEALVERLWAFAFN